MHRIDTSGHVANRFSEGNPIAGQIATRLSAAWFNDTQENICKLIEHAGIALVKGNETQLRDAIVALIAGVVGTGGGSVPTTRQVNGGGLVTGGGPLAADLTLTVTKALAADVLAGLADDRAITPYALAQAVTKSLGNPGYVKRVDGMIEMRGSTTINANTNTVVTLPIVFPNACLWAGVEAGQQIGNDLNDNLPFVSGIGTGSISVWSSHDSPVTGLWFAYGH